MHCGWQSGSHGRETDEQSPSPGAEDEVSAKDNSLLGRGEGGLAFSLIRSHCHTARFALDLPLSTDMAQRLEKGSWTSRFRARRPTKVNAPPATTWQRPRCVAPV